MPARHGLRRLLDAAVFTIEIYWEGIMTHSILSPRAAKTPAIVVIGDGQTITEFLRSQRRLKEYAIIRVQLPSEVLRLLKQRPIRLVVCDDQAPGMRSLDLMSEIKQLSPQTHVVLMVPSGSHDQEHRAKAAGADTYLPSMFAHKRLQILLEDILA
jgi:DNA-binding NtrC family response regulator